MTFLMICYRLDHIDHVDHTESDNLAVPNSMEDVSMSKTDVKKASIDNELIKRTLHNLRPKPCMITGDCQKTKKGS